jgi:serine/threonine-protein kinase
MALLGSVVSAQAQTGNDQAAAEVLFEQGKALLGVHDYGAACAKFEASQSLDSGIGTLLYLGDCYERLGRTASAWAAFREAESLAAGSGQDQRREVAVARVRALGPKLVWLTIQVAPENTQLAGFELLRDGVPIPEAAFGVAAPIDPGKHTIVAHAPNKQRYSKLVTIGPDSIALTVPELVDVPREGSSRPAPARSLAPARPRPDPPPRGKTQRAVGYTLGIAGIAGLGVGGYFGIVAIDRNARSKHACRPNDPSLCNARGVRLRRDAQTAATASTLAFAAGGALFGTGLVLWLTAPRPSERAASVALWVSPGEGGVGGFW